MFAIGAIAPWVVERLKTEPRSSRFAVGGLLVAVLTLGVIKSATRTLTWKNSHTVFVTLADDAPLDFKAHYVMGGMEWEEHHGLQAEIEWQVAIKLLPDYYGVRMDLAHRYREMHRCDVAIPEYVKTLEIEPSLPLARVGLIACYLEMSQFRQARTTALVAKADGFSPRALDFLVELADSSLAKNDSGGGINQWTGHHKRRKP
jgi:hypothetical protein